MILAALVGWSLQRFAGLDGALLPAVLAGMLLAPLVPARACAVRGRAGARAGDGPRS